MAESSGLVTVVGDDGKTYVADQKTVQAKQVQQMMAQGGNFFGTMIIANLPKNCQKKTESRFLKPKSTPKDYRLRVCLLHGCVKGLAN